MVMVSAQPSGAPSAAAGAAGAPADVATEEAVRYLLQRMGLPRVLQAFKAEWCGSAELASHMAATVSPTGLQGRHSRLCKTCCSPEACHMFRGGLHRSAVP